MDDENVLPPRKPDAYEVAEGVFTQVAQDLIYCRKSLNPLLTMLREHLISEEAKTQGPFPMLLFIRTQALDNALCGMENDVATLRSAIAPVMNTRRQDY